MSKIVNERIENMDKKSRGRSATDDHNSILILVVRPVTN